MAAGSRAMGRGRGHPQPGTAAFPNLAGAEDGTLPFSHCSSAVGIQNWGAKGQGRVAISMVRGSVGALRGDRKGGHLALVSTVILPAGEGTHLRVRAGWDLKTFLLLTWRCGPSPLLSSPLLMAPLNPTESSTGPDRLPLPPRWMPSPDPPHGPIVPGRKWMDVKGERGHRLWPTAIANQIAPRRASFRPVPWPGVRVWGWSPHRVGQLGNQWSPLERGPRFSGRQETSPLQICHDVALNGLSSRQRAKRFPPHFQPFATRTG